MITRLTVAILITGIAVNSIACVAALCVGP